MSNKKSEILVNLKKQVMILKSQLDILNQRKLDLSISKSKEKSKGKKPLKITSRFDSNYLDGEIVGSRGLKRFGDRDSHFRNLSELITNKSTEDRIPKLSPYRKAEYIKTKENFDTQPLSVSPRKGETRNPLTGEGYAERRHGIKMVSRPDTSREGRTTGRKHFNFY